jgi:K(+)-stimulated pyrophosphate-energized sodium pump
MDLTLAFAAGALALLVAGYIVVNLRKQDSGTEKMKEISGAIKAGSIAYLKRQFKTISIFAVILFIILTALKWQLGVTFVAGAVLSALAGSIGMYVSVTTNTKVAAAAKTGMDNAFRMAFRGGAVTGLFVVGLSLLGVAFFYQVFSDPGLIIGFGFGASLISLFARVGGGIFTKAADVGADLVGKIEAGIPEDDPRNPAVIADNVGDNVGDCAGMGADLFESYAVTALAAMLLGFLLEKSAGALTTYPLILGAAGIVASIIGILSVRKVGKAGIMMAMYKGTAVAYIIAAVLFYLITDNMLAGNPVLKDAGLTSMGVFISALTGLFVAFAIILITEYYTAKNYSPVKTIAEASQTGPGTNIITGLAIGLESTTLPALIICAAIFISYSFGGVYGIAIATMALLSVTGLIVTMDSYGPITDNAGGIAEMANLEPEVRKITDALDAVGNTTKAVTKGFAIGSAALAALALFASYTMEAEKLIDGNTQLMTKFGMDAGQLVFDLGDPAVLIGLFIGGLLPFLFSSFLMRAVGKAAFEIVGEVRRQFKEIAGIMEGTGKPDYARCVDIVTKAALKEMTMPAIIAVAAPLAVGFLLGPIALGGLLVGCIVTGLLLALMMATGGAAWDNAKKYIEDGNYGGKKTPTHAAAVVGDTVGDPFKDTAGPALNPLIKVVNMIALLALELIVTIGFVM